jgi:hypothetical protein
VTAGLGAGLVVVLPGALGVAFASGFGAALGWARAGVAASLALFGVTAGAATLDLAAGFFAVMRFLG